MKSIIVLCTGEIGSKLLSYGLKSDCVIVGVYDNNEKKWGNTINGYSINNPSEIKDQNFDIAIIASTKYEVIVQLTEQLIELGVSREKQLIATEIVTAEYFAGELDKYFDIPKKALFPFKKGPAEIYQEYTGETFKAHDRRLREGFFDKYCKGEGLDIGYGADIIVPGCSGWDLRHGDAQYLDGIEDESFDFVYSSHCLEHMSDVRIALKNWFRVVRKGGFLILAIPHRDLYEKKDRLPSRWNTDHKHMFLIGKEEAPDTLDIIKEIKESIDGYDIKYVKACDENHTITDPLVHSDGEYQIEIVIQRI